MPRTLATEILRKNKEAAIRARGGLEGKDILNRIKKQNKKSTITADYKRSHRNSIANDPAYAERWS